MEPEVEFKFEPFTVTALSLFTLFMSYRLGVPIIKEGTPDTSLLLPAIVPAIFLWVVLPMTFSMIRSIPALIITKDYLVYNINGLSIEWADISEIKNMPGGYRSFGYIAINLKQPEKYFNTPLKKIKYQIVQLFVADDIRIRFDLIAGKNDTIAQVVTAYWDKHADL